MMKISEVSEQYELSADTLRYYERIGLLPPVIRSAAVTVRRPGARIVPKMRTSTFAKVGAVKATENTDSNCIISSDGLGMTFSWACSCLELTLPQVVHAFPSTLKIGQNPG
jgi:hypothetical protein